MEEDYLQKFLDGKTQEISLNEITYQIEQVAKNSKKQLASVKEIEQNISLQRGMYRSMPNILPCKGSYSHLNFGYRIHPITGEYEFHKGVDISNEHGTKILATADGVVKTADWMGGYGRLVVIEHSYGYETRYAHLSKILVRPGDKVVRGSIVGLMGSTGLSTCPHLHYEVRSRNTPLNPAKFLTKDSFFKYQFRF